ncbi:MAG: hypothetical protein K2O59_13295 [Lachnospiraceae bacterium]|nr:hypothetical protein [Lachnospiraceae bacterium]
MQNILDISVSEMTGYLCAKGILIIAHRLTTTKKADRIIVLSRGRKIEEGNHEELMRRKGHYYNMFTAQAKQYCFADL